MVARLRKYILTLAALLAAAAVDAQGFIDHVESSAAGEGSVSVVQDQRLTNIINGQAGLDDVKENDDFDVQVVRRQKVRGYRVQMFWGGSSRADQQKAQRIGTQVTSVFPELEAYTTFDSPHWRCRVGNFTTRQEAAQYLTKLRRISKDAMIVRSEVFVYQ